MQGQYQGGVRACRRLERRLFCAVGMALWMLGLLVGGGPAAWAQQAQAPFVTEYQIDRDAVEVPFEYFNHQILVRGDADTKKDLTLLFDTGATSPVLDKSLGLVSYHLGDSVIHEAEGDAPGETVWLDNLRLGGKEGDVRAHNIPALLMDLSQMSQVLGRKVDGVVGLSFMAGYVVEIDYQQRRLRFYHPRYYSVSQRQPDNRRDFLFDLIASTEKGHRSLVHVTGKLHGSYDYEFLLDTGFGGYVSVALAAAQEAGLFRQTTPRLYSTSYSVSHRFRTAKIRAPFLMLGEIDLSNRVIQVDFRNAGTYGQSGIIGNRFLQNYRVTLDYLRRKLWLERITTKEEPDEAEKPALGLSIRTDGKTVSVEKVARYSPADTSGVHPGDVLVAINGQPVSEMSTVQVANLLASPHGAMTLALARGANPTDGTGGDFYSLTLQPTSPLDWEAPRLVR